MASAHSEAAKMEQIVTEFFAKTLQIILESRSAGMSSRNFSGDQALSSPSSTSSSSSSVRPRDKWFNLALRECPATLENSDLWCHNNLEPMVIDVVLVQRPVDFDPVSFSPRKDFLSMKERYSPCTNSDREELFGCEAKSERVIERWIVRYENRKVRDSSNYGNRRLSNSHLYKKTILLLRSLYVTVRLLPAYKIYHDLNSSSQLRSFTLAHRVSTFVDPFTRREEAEMQRFVFTPVDTPTGRLCLSVLYHSSPSDAASSESSTPLSPQVITDYVGSPLADPLKRFPFIPVTRSTSQDSPSSTPFIRRHSWSFDIYKASSPLPSFSPSPTHSETRVSTSNPNTYNLFPPSILPSHPREKSSVNKIDQNFDEYLPSPIFSLSPSASPSPSPPICIPGSQMTNSLLRSESAPVRIPTPKFANNNSPAFLKQNLPPSSPLKGSRYSISRFDKGTGVAHSGSQNDKLFSHRKEDARQCSGLKLSSNSSPQKSFSRSSSQSMPDDFDESDFVCPFEVDVDDIPDPAIRPESFEQTVGLCHPHDPRGLFSARKSQDAAVGELVLMLRKAQPLRQDYSKSVVANSSSESRPDVVGNTLPESDQATKNGNPSVQHADSSTVMGSTSGLTLSKTTTDALEELQGYRDLKNLLLAQRSKSHI